jgi:beta-lactamase regulating signal transducer with metallopeptidase domain
MIPSIIFLNHSGESFLDFAGPMFCQSSLLILCIFALDFVMARKIRAAVRYALWLVILVKLRLPPTLAPPTGPAWWFFHATSAVAPIAKQYVITYDATSATQDLALANLPMPSREPTALKGQGWALLTWGLASAGLLLWLLIRWWQIRQIVRRATPSEYLCGELEAARSAAGWRHRVRLKLITRGLPPSVCGLFRPVILLPRTLVENLSPA